MPNSKNFRNDEEFINIIKNQTEQQVRLDMLKDKVSDGFIEIKEHLDELKTHINGKIESCANYKSKDDITKDDITKDDDDKPKPPFSLYDALSPHLLKLFALILVSIIACIFGLPLPK